MRRDRQISTGGLIFFLVLLNVIVVKHGFITHPQWYKAAFFTFPLLVVSVFFYQRKRM